MMTLKRAREIVEAYHHHNIAARVAKNKIALLCALTDDEQQREILRTALRNLYEIENAVVAANHEHTWEDVHARYAERGNRHNYALRPFAAALEMVRI